MQSIIDKEEGFQSIGLRKCNIFPNIIQMVNDNISETCIYLLNAQFSVYMLTDYDFSLDLENPPKNLKEILDTLDEE